MFIGFGFVYIAVHHFNYNEASNKIDANTFYLLLALWWSSLLSFCSLWVALVLHGRGRNNHFLIKMFQLIFPIGVIVMAAVVSVFIISCI